MQLVFDTERDRDVDRQPAPVMRLVLPRRVPSGPSFSFGAIRMALNANEDRHEQAAYSFEGCVGTWPLADQFTRFALFNLKIERCDR